jgi:serine/threonine protein kinase
MSEKQALMTLKHPFLVMMMATYKSKDYLYFLLEPGACDVVRCMCVCMFSNNFSKHDFTYTHPLTTHAHTHSSSLFLSLSLSLSHTHNAVLGGELFTHLRKSNMFSPRDARFYAASVVLAFEYMHQKGIVYRDLKPGNVE